MPTSCDSDARSVQGLRQRRPGGCRGRSEPLHDAAVATLGRRRRIAWEPVTIEGPAAALDMSEAEG